jgi:polar amino acid transport system substrate-binding protein
VQRSARFAISLIAVSSLAFAACGSDSASTSETTVSAETPAETTPAETVAAETPAETTPAEAPAETVAAETPAETVAAEATETTAAGAAAGAMKMVKEGVLTVCTHLPYKPFEFKDESGAIVGFDIDLINLTAEKLGAKMEIIDVPFEAITGGTAYTQCDVGIAGTTITDERKNAVLFSEPYFDATQALIAKADGGITGLADLKGKKLGAQADTTGLKYAQDNAAANGYEVVQFDDLALEMAAVKAGQVDAAVNDNGVVFDFSKENPDTKVVAEFNTGEQYGISANKTGSEALMAVVNATIAESKTNGKYDELFQKWFGALPVASANS